MKVEVIVNEMILERAIKKDRERVIRLIDNILVHLPICLTNSGIVGANCNCGIERLKMDVEDGDEVARKPRKSTKKMR